MRTRGCLVAALAGVALVSAGVTGCSGPPSAPAVSPTSTRTPYEPTFASLDEAFQAAVDSFSKYVDVSNQIGAEGGVEASRLLTVVVDNDWAAEELATFNEMETYGTRLEGGMTFTKPRLFQYQDVDDLIQMYACADVSGAQIVNEAGENVTPERQDTIPLLVSFSITATTAVLVSKVEVWDRAGIC